MPRKPTLSPTRLTTYLACPVKYRWTYVDGRGRWYLRAKSYYSFGTSLHRTLEALHASDGAGVPPTEAVLSSFEENWIDAGFRSPEEMAEAFGEGQAILEQYVETTRQRPPDVRTFLVEANLRHDMGLFDLIGRVDRVDEHPDGSLEIIDYKSGRQGVSDDEVRTDLAMNCYQLMLSRSHPERNIRCTIVALRGGVSASAALSADELDGFEADLRLLGGQILTDEFFDFEPRVKRICAECDFLPLCRKHGEFAEAFGS